MEAYYILGSLILLSFVFTVSLVMDLIYSPKDIIIRKKPEYKPVVNDYELDDDLLINE
jgi:ABC-type microcin C transport system permease subunit YejE